MGPEICMVQLTIVIYWHVVPSLPRVQVSPWTRLSRPMWKQWKFSLVSLETKNSPRGYNSCQSHWVRKITRSVFKRIGWQDLNLTGKWKMFMSTNIACTQDSLHYLLKLHFNQLSTYVRVCYFKIINFKFKTRMVFYLMFSSKTFCPFI